MSRSYKWSASFRLLFQHPVCISLLPVSFSFSAVCKPRRSSLYICIQSPGTSSLYTLPSSLFSITLSLCFSVTVRRPSVTPIQNNSPLYRWQTCTVQCWNNHALKIITELISRTTRQIVICCWCQIFYSGTPSVTGVLKACACLNTFLSIRCLPLRRHTAAPLQISVSQFCFRKWCRIVHSTQMCCGQCADFGNVRASGTYSYHSTVRLLMCNVRRTVLWVSSILFFPVVIIWPLNCYFVLREIAQSL